MLSYVHHPVPSTNVAKGRPISHCRRRTVLYKPGSRKQACELPFQTLLTWHELQSLNSQSRTCIRPLVAKLCGVPHRLHEDSSGASFAQALYMRAECLALIFLFNLAYHIDQMSCEGLLYLRCTCHSMRNYHKQVSATETAGICS